MSHEDKHPFIHRLPVKDRQGKLLGEKEVVSYRGLLDLAHRDGLRTVRTRLLQPPTKENRDLAIVLAEVCTNHGTFTGIGDASPESVHPRMTPHLVRLAETPAPKHGRCERR